MTVEQLLIKATTIANEVVVREAPRADKEGLWLAETMQALKESKLTGLVVPKSCGGHGHGLYALARLSEELGKAYSSAGLCFGMHCVGSAVIAAKATAWQKESYLEPIAQGKHITSLALSETGTGAHFYFPQTSLIAVTKDEFIINGSKTFVTNGSHADSYVVSTMGASHDADPDQFSCVVLDADKPGMDWGREWDGLGMRGNSSRSLLLNDVHIAGKSILGEPGDQLWYVFNVVAPYFLIGMSGTYLGIAEAALKEVIRILSRRSYSYNGTNLSSVSIVQHRLGTIYTKVERTRRLVYHAAVAGDNGDADALLAIMSAKADVADCVVEVVNEVMTLAGGIGFQNNSYLGMLLRDARAAHVMSPTTDLLNTWIGRALLEQPILGD
ncbi:acyl-CoA dehydrogenase family protein [Desertivirga xinjiangensis]|uniref:acyl-CoA dehydrogenase family protein n=1 Tax=Desertivirga xinjiangensis TaxID=539206 RepID=UPI002109427F|nr:acyl-CoA dehydrogenase family protein [Pedobacter xinjiangensis]